MRASPLLYDIIKKQGVFTTLTLLSILIESILFSQVFHHSGAGIDIECEDIMFSLCCFYFLFSTVHTL